MQSRDTRTACLSLAGLHLSDRLTIKFAGHDGGKSQATLPDKYVNSHQQTCSGAFSINAIAQGCHGSTAQYMQFVT